MNTLFQMRRISQYSTIGHKKWFACLLSSKSQQSFERINKILNEKKSEYEINPPESSNSQPISDDKQKTPEEKKKKFLSDEQKVELKNYSMPLFKTQLEFKFNPLYWKVKEQYNPFLHILVSFIWPETRSEEQVSTLIKFIEVFFKIDDLEDNKKAEESFNLLLAVINGKTIEDKQLPEQRNAVLISEVLKTLEKSKKEKKQNQENQSKEAKDENEFKYTDDQLKRLRKSMYRGVDAMKTAFLDKDEKKFKTLKDYIESSRMETIGVQPIVNLIPYSIGVDVTKYLSDPRMIELEISMKQHGMIINDYYSYKKEIAKKDDHIKFNMFLALYKTFGDCEWAYRTMNMYVEYIEMNILENKRSLLKVAEYERNDDLRRYLNGLEYVCSGFHKFSLISPRYNDFNKLDIDNSLPIDPEFNYFVLKKDVKEILVKIQKMKEEKEKQEKEKLSANKVNDPSSN